MNGPPKSNASLHALLYVLWFCLVLPTGCLMLTESKTYKSRQSRYLSLPEGLEMSEVSIPGLLLATSRSSVTKKAEIILNLKYSPLYIKDVVRFSKPRVLAVMWWA